MKTPKSIIMWVLTIFMALVAFAYFPSITSIIAIIFVVIAAPISPLQEFFSGHGFHGVIKGIVLCAAFIGAIMVAPAKETADVPTEQPTCHISLPPKASAATESPSQDKVRPVASEPAEPAKAPTSEPTLEPTPEPTVKPIPEPTPVPTSAPTSAPTSKPAPEPTPKPTQSPSGNSGNGGSWGDSSTTSEITGDLSQTAYWVPRGKSYHFSSNCPSFSESSVIRSGTLQDALNAGKTDPCNNCAGGS